MNQVVLNGKLAFSTEAAKSTTTGKSVIGFVVAVPTDESELKFVNIPCKAWEKNAVAVANQERGIRVAVKGKLSRYSYAKDDGSKVWVMEVVAEQVKIGDAACKK